MTFENPSENIRFPHLALELQEMNEADQNMRQRKETDGSWDATVDLKHTERLKEIIAEIGWPTISKVGEAGANNAWRLVQHADHDTDFQEQCLLLMKESSATEVEQKDVAYLEDRVRVSQGKEQLYGTQVTVVDGVRAPLPIEDEPNVDIRRAEVGMEPLNEYLQNT